METEPSAESTSVLNKKEVQEFIAQRQIQAEDLHLIEELAKFPKNLIVAELHNLFNLSRDRSGKELEGLIGNCQDVTQRSLYETVLDFYNKYDWMTAWSLIRVLEKI